MQILSVSICPGPCSPSLFFFITSMRGIGPGLPAFLCPQLRPRSVCLLLDAQVDEIPSGSHVYSGSYTSHKGASVLGCICNSLFKKKE